MGLVNAALWLGASVFFTLAVGTAFFSEKGLAVFGGPQNAAAARYYAGAMAQVVLERYFLMQQICGAIALVHISISWIYTGRPLHRTIISLVLAAFLIGCLEAHWVQPKLHGLHRTMYGFDRVTVAQANQARKSFGLWHGFSQILNLVAVISITGYFWRLNRVESGPRFTTQTKFSWE